MKSIGILNMLDILTGEDYYYIPSNEKDIKNFLLGHTIKKVGKNTLELDNGVELYFDGNKGCGGCDSGNYYITELNECNNVITNVEFADNVVNNYGKEHSYKIFVYAENKKIKLLQCDGDDGNGYYGTGYHMKVRLKEEVENEKI